MVLRLKLDIVTGAFEERVQRWNGIIARTATLAMDDARNNVLTEGRANIAQAGGKFGAKWTSALRATRYPKGRDSMSPAVFVHHKIPYAGLFEDGGTVTGSPMMWLPLPTTPQKVARGRTTPAKLAAAAGQPLISMGTSKKGRPLLGMQIRVPKTQASKGGRYSAGINKVTLGRLRNAASPGGRGILRTVPLFVGIDSAKHRKRFNIAAVAQDTRDRLPAYYAKNFRED